MSSPIVFIPGSRLVAAGNDRGDVTLWDGRSGGTTSAMAFAATGRRLLTAGHDGPAQIWSTRRRRPPRNLALPGSRGGFVSVAWRSRRASLGLDFSDQCSGFTLSSMPKRPALLRRLPRLFGTVPSRPIVAAEDRAQYSDLETEFAFLDEHLVPKFEQHDKAALRGQNSFRRQQLTLILGGASTTILGSLHASLGSGWKWAAFAEAILAGVLVMVVLIAQSKHAQRRYLESRLRAEKLRGEFFRYIARVGSYSDDALRGDELRRRVAELTAADDE